MLAGAIAYAQQQSRGRIWVGGDRRGAGAHFADLDDFNGSFLYCRGYFASNRGEGGGGGWRTDYPGADNNFSVRLGELTKFDVPLDESSRAELRRRAADRRRCSSSARCSSWKTSARRTSTRRRGPAPAGVLPEGRLPLGRRLLGLVRVGAVGRARSAGSCRRASFRSSTCRSTHPIMHTLYDVKEKLQVPAISFWYRSGGQHVGAGPRQRGGALPWHPGFARAADGR